MKLRTLIACWLIFLLAAGASSPRPPGAEGDRAGFSERGNEVTLFALGLIDTGYRFYSYGDAMAIL